MGGGPQVRRGGLSARHEILTKCVLVNKLTKKENSNPEPDISCRLRSPHPPAPLLFVDLVGSTEVS